MSKETGSSSRALQYRLDFAAAESAPGMISSAASAARVIWSLQLIRVFLLADCGPPGLRRTIGRGVKADRVSFVRVEPSVCPPRLSPETRSGFIKQGIVAQLDRARSFSSRARCSVVLYRWRTGRHEPGYNWRRSASDTPSACIINRTRGSASVSFEDELKQAFSRTPCRERSHHRDRQATPSGCALYPEGSFVALDAPQQKLSKHRKWSHAHGALSFISK